jgi:NitT/TauT family transport system ATP-binding protein
MDCQKCRGLFWKFNLTIQKGERIGIFAPNGCGKTTLFNIISGIDGDFQGVVNSDFKRLSYMNQDPKATLLPWYNSKKNILLMRNYHRKSLGEGLKLLNVLIDALNVNFSLSLYPFQLSGGQAQIIALIRALIIEPDFLLMDEPFSALDMEKRDTVREVLQTLSDRGTTMLLCSHRGDEVNTILNRAVLLESKSETGIMKDIRLKDFKTRNEFESYIATINYNQFSKEISPLIVRDSGNAGRLAGNRLVRAV